MNRFQFQIIFEAYRARHLGFAMCCAGIIFLRHFQFQLPYFLNPPSKKAGTLTITADFPAGGLA